MERKVNNMNKSLDELNELFKPEIIEITSEYNTHYFNMLSNADVRAFEYFKNDEAVYYSYCLGKLNISI